MPERNPQALPPDILRGEDSVIEWLSRLNRHYVDTQGTAGLGRAKTQEHVSRLLYFATGHTFEVRQVIPPPIRPPLPYGRYGRRWR